MRKLLAALLALLLVIPCAFAEEEPAATKVPEPKWRGNYVYYLLEDGTAEISFYMGSSEPEESLVIPDSLDGIPVTSIGKDAFMDDSLKEITIPDTVTRIRDKAFEWSESLTKITIPDSVTDMGANPFTGCGNLTEIIVSPDHPYLEIVDGVLFSKPDHRLVSYPFANTAASYVVPDGTEQPEE